MEEKPHFNPERLRLLRESLGLFQAGLSRSLHITQAALSKLESGDINPSEDVLKRIAEYFGYPVAYFQKGSQFIPSGLVFHRKRASLPAKLRTQLEAEAKLRVLDVLKMREYAGFSSNLIDRAERSPEECARELRKHWNVEANCPIDNLVELCEKNGVLVLSFDFGTEKIDGFFLSLSESQLTLIVLNDSEVFTPDRRRFSLAHELGHAVLHQYHFPDQEAEEEANRFAAEFLEPEDGITPDILKAKDARKFISLKELFELKKKWKVSMAAILYRAKSLRLIDENDYRRLCVYMSSQGYRKREPLADIALEQPKALKNLFENCSQKVSENMQTFLELPDNVFKSRYGFSQTKGGNMSP